MAAPPNPMVPPPGVAPYVHHTKIVRAMLAERGVKGKWAEFGEAEGTEETRAKRAVTVAPPAPPQTALAYPKPPPKPLRKAQPKAKR